MGVAVGPRLEGSRFITMQIYGQAAGGSRKLPNACHRPTATKFSAARRFHPQPTEQTAPQMASGSRMLPTNRTAIR